MNKIKKNTEEKLNLDKKYWENDQIDKNTLMYI